MVEQFTYFNSVKQSTISISFEKVDYFTFWLGRLFYKVDQNVVPQMVTWHFWGKKSKIVTAQGRKQKCFFFDKLIPLSLAWSSACSNWFILHRLTKLQYILSNFFSLRLLVFYIYKLIKKSHLFPLKSRYVQIITLTEDYLRSHFWNQKCS